MGREIVVTPTGKDAIEVGSLSDDAGERFVVIHFRQPDGDSVLVTLQPDLCDEFATHLGRVAEQARR